MEYGDPPYQPLPLTVNMFASMLETICGMTSMEANEWCHVNIRNNPAMQGMSMTNLDPALMLSKFLPEIPEPVKKISRQSIVFRFPFMRELAAYWSVIDLNRLPITKLMELSDLFTQDPELFAYNWMHNYDLPEISAFKLHRRLANMARKRNESLDMVPDLPWREGRFLQGYDRRMLTRVEAYEKAKTYFKNHPQLSIHEAALKHLNFAPAPCKERDAMLPLSKIGRAHV